MKILDIPQSGKRGLNVSQGGRYGQISRALAIPTNPQTMAQRTIRSNFSSVSQNWRKLTDEQRAAWIAVAATIQTKSRLGQSGAMTGSQLFNKINCALLAISSPTVVVPPARPSIEPLTISALVITNTVAGGVKLSLTAPDAPPEGTMLRASAPMSAGRTVCKAFVLLGTLDSPVGNAVDITAAYTARYGAPTAGSRVFVQVNQNQNGWEDLPLSFAAVVPAAS